MRELRVKGLWSEVTRNVKKTILEMDQVGINLNPNQREKMTYNATSVRKIST